MKSISFTQTVLNIFLLFVCLGNSRLKNINLVLLDFKYVKNSQYIQFAINVKIEENL